jgi:hypothetical protein
MVTWSLTLKLDPNKLTTVEKRYANAELSQKEKTEVGIRIPAFTCTTEIMKWTQQNNEFSIKPVFNCRIWYKSSNDKVFRKY